MCVKKLPKAKKRSTGKENAEQAFHWCGTQEIWSPYVISRTHLRPQPFVFLQARAENLGTG